MIETAEIWAEFSERLQRYIQKRVGNLEDAKDILQDVFESVHSSSRQVDNLPAWLYRITMNKVIDYYRSNGRTLPLENPEQLVASEPDKDFTGCLVPLINKLDKDERKLIKHQLAGHPLRELAVTGVSYDTLKSKSLRARARLHALFFDCCRVNSISQLESQCGDC